VGKSRGQLGRLMGARGLWTICCLLLASALLAGCNKTSGTSDAASATSTAATATSTAATTTSAAAPTNKTADVTWTAPTTNTNGTALTDLAGYRIYYGTNPTALSKSVNVPSAAATDYIVQGLTQGTWYFAVTAYTNTGVQSNFSTVVSKTIT
jgi:hypothetical protein